MTLKAHFLAALAGLSMGLFVGSLVLAPGPALGYFADQPRPCPVNPPRYPCRANGNDCESAGQRCHDNPQCVCEQTRNGCRCVTFEDPGNPGN